MSVQYVYRIVVDSWPTENGKPFTAQGFQYWEKVVDAFRTGEPVPSWLPADFVDWLTPDDRDEIFGSGIPAKWGYSVIDHCDEHLMNVPRSIRVRRFSEASLTDRLADLLAWGCVARIERAPIGEWEDVA